MTSLLRTLALVVLLLGGAAAAEAREGEVAAAKLKDAEALYAAGDFESASRGLNEILIRDQGLSPEARARLYLLKARLELAYGRSSEIRLWLAKAHDANPTLALDPVKDPPQLNAIWEDLKQEGGAALPESKPAGGGLGNFYVGLLPLGIGHLDAGKYKDGLLFTSSEALFLLASSMVEKKRDQRILGTLAFLGAYGYELFDLLPTQTTRDADSAASLRFGLSFFPFGVAQAKNGDYTKAFGIATVESVLLTVGVMSTGESQRNVALGLFMAAWAYGILDGVANHQDRLADTESEPEAPFSVGFQPATEDGRLSGLVVSTLRF